MTRLTGAQAGEFYAVHRERPFYGDLVRFMTSGPCVPMILEAEGAVLKLREVMSRSIMCISEDQSLVEAANLMSNKGVSQLPVVRGGELVGFLTVDTALHLLFGPGRKVVQETARELPGPQVE